MPLFWYPGFFSNLETAVQNKDTGLCSVQIVCSTSFPVWHHHCLIPEVLTKAGKPNGGSLYISILQSSNIHHHYLVKFTFTTGTRQLLVIISCLVLIDGSLPWDLILSHMMLGPEGLLPPIVWPECSNTQGGSWCPLSIFRRKLASMLHRE
jgi:hypothetical protein